MTPPRSRPPLAALFATLVLALPAAAETLIFEEHFEAGALCSTGWSAVANPEACNGADDDCDGAIDELLIDCNVCAPPAAVEEALAGVEFAFCVPEIVVPRDLVTATICSENLCDGEPGCAVSGEISSATVDAEAGVIAMTVVVADAVFDVTITIATPPVEGGCDLLVSNITAEVTVLFTTTEVAPGVEEIDAITSVEASTSFDLAVDACGTQLVEDALNAILAFVEEAIGAAFDEQLAAALEEVLAERLVGVPLCTG
jgi:hypothetical protein